MAGSETGWLLTALEILAALFIFVVGLAALTLVVTYVLDVTQTRQALRRNYPVLVHFRYAFERLGTFFRQYFFAMDREEMPFNRAQRAWVYRAAKNVDNTIAFGSTRDLRPAGTVLFANTPYPTLNEDAVPPRAVTIGADCPHPYVTQSIFNISGMSYGAISRPAVLALSTGAKLAGCWLNTGEGGLSPWHLEGGADLVFQIGTAKFGVRDAAGRLDENRLMEIAAHPQVKMFEIKLSQGAKPGKGGILPGAKVTPQIAAIRGIAVGEAAISPNRHPEIASDDALLDMIARVRVVSGKPVGIKTVLGDPAWLDRLCTAIVARGAVCAPDYIALDGAEGGSGAAPQALMDDVGLPLREALPLLVDKLVAHGLRERIKVVAAGKLVTPADVAWALCAGADFAASARGFMFALGCIQALQCNRNTCPTGIATHNPRLQRGLVPADKAERVAHYHRNLTYEVGLIAHACGVREPRELSRQHCRVVGADGLSQALSALHPEP
ncbi:MAG: FMN-binding glutamate synthase family protein [Hydrogenophilales bacterium 16-64-46]|nr:MAG: FMN-binding glutamate synthase family protein [Hydrogenophilales bacterium 12-64-13]OYZ04090.1 MAG: FMN-binding glutamate synthase family protein [Hydrogenophilales bacterium 16-64-46]OZA36839.1 MAG: FMN-binding glutamate synthase family protein [Hydrogenophilales bacterium 17-64-34]HQT00049.1 FMN-binding glutamate synthase family protein [Thiobacillus sp.]